MAKRKLQKHSSLSVMKSVRGIAMMHQALLRHFSPHFFGTPEVNLDCGRGSSVVLLHLRNNNIPNGKDNFRYE